MRTTLPLLVVLLLQGCASAPPASVFDRVAERPVRVVPLDNGSPSPAATPNADTRAVLARARQQQSAAQKASPGYQDRDRLLAQAEAAAREGNNPRAQSLARQATARAETAVEVARTREAAGLLKALYDTTGLTDTQLAAIRAAETQLVRGDNVAALNQLKSIRARAQQPRPYEVRRGDTLTAIAARENVYGNSLLWPLIWEANRDTLPDPNRLRPGQRLKIRPSPSVEEVVKAIAAARQYPSRVRIGKVRTIPNP